MDATLAHSNARGVTGGVRSTLRLEGALVLALCTLAYARGDASWWWFAGAFFLPDLSFIGYAGGAALGARVYNVAHCYGGPLLLAIAALQGSNAAWIVPAALVWGAHIGFDRLMGYGLKYETAFADTHLGRIGRGARTSRTAIDEEHR